MNILTELTALLSGFAPIETGVFSEVAPDEYIVLTPLSDNFALFGDNRPEFETKEVRVSIYSKKNYLELTNRITKALISNDFTITARIYLGFETDTKYHHYAVDCVKPYAWEG
jgi:hypothetical protein